jgi:hypothetical protein
MSKMRVKLRDTRRSTVEISDKSKDKDLEEFEDIKEETSTTDDKIKIAKEYAEKSDFDPDYDDEDINSK